MARRAITCSQADHDIGCACACDPTIHANLFCVVIDATQPQTQSGLSRGWSRFRELNRCCGAAGEEEFEGVGHIVFASAVTNTRLKNLNFLAANVVASLGQHGAARPAHDAQ